MRFIPIIALIAVITGAVPRAGPDFAGVWKLDRSLSDPSGPGKDVTLTVSQEGDALILVREVEARSIEARYDLAGRPTENILPNGQTATSTARWDGTTILVSTRQPVDETTFTTAEERLSLTGSGHLRIEKRVQMPNTEFRSVEVFVRVRQPA